MTEITDTLYIRGDITKHSKFVVHCCYLRPLASMCVDACVNFKRECHEDRTRLSRAINEIKSLHRILVKIQVSFLLKS